jgi:tetratricopeptide (TPR) repeat protein
VTSRNSLSGLVASEGAYPLMLDLLSQAEARQFLAHRLGAKRVAAEGQAVDEIIDSCARLPLALAVVAARAATHPHLPLDTLASELRESRDRLDMLAGSEATTDVRAVFSWSYLALSAPAARLFRLLGIHPGPDITVRAAASLAGIELGQARRLLAELTRAHLVAEHRPGRYRSHDLLRVYATELTESHDSAVDRHAAALRMLDHYLHSAVAADGMLDSSRPSLPLASVQPGVVLDRPDDQRAALAWFAAERQVLMAAASYAADHGHETHCWQLAWALETVLDRMGHWQDLTTTLRIALEAVRRLADRGGEARIHRGLARAYARIGRHEDAYDHLRRALRLYQEDGDYIGQASAHRNIAYVHERQVRYRDALAHEQRALALFEAANDKAGQARCLNGLGWYHALLGEYEQGIDYCQRALSLHEPTNVHAQAVTWDSLGYAHHKLGHHHKAIACYQRALDLYRETGDRLYEAGALRYVGDCHHAAGDTDTAREEWQRALSILEDLHHPDAEQLRSRLTATSAESR